VLCGQPWFEECIGRLDAAARIQWRVAEGALTSPGAVVSTSRPAGPRSAGAERPALNFLQLLSGTRPTSPPCGCDRRSLAQSARLSILDTRKTLPGLRLAQKYAVRTGGGSNHRLGSTTAF